MKSKATKKRNKKARKTRKRLYKGGSNEQLQEEQRQKNLFRRTLNNSIIQITNKKNIKQAINSIIKLFDKNKMINTLIPITSSGKPVDIQTYTNAKKPVKIDDFVSPITIIFDNLSGLISNEDLLRILNAYFINGGNFNNISSRLKKTPLEYELDKNRQQNINILLDKNNAFHLIKEGINSELVAELPTSYIQETIPKNVTNIPIKLALDQPLPAAEYDRATAPEFWQPIFDDELIALRERIQSIYDTDKFIEGQGMKRLAMCDLLEKIAPGYFTKYTLNYNETPKTNVTFNFLGCIITLLYGIISYKLYDTNQDYIFMFKGGRALQLSLSDIKNVGKYFSEDADILIVPNKSTTSVYDLEKMRNLAGHLAYLIKWFIPSDINIVVSLPDNPNNTNKEITKLLYNDNRLYKALSDIGFGKLSDIVAKYFENPNYFVFYVDDFESNSLFIVPTIKDMLTEKLFFYMRYSLLLALLDSTDANKPQPPKGYENITRQECSNYMFKFNRAIKHLVSSLIVKDYGDITDPYEIADISRLIISEYMHNIDEFSNIEKNKITNELFPLPKN